MNAILIPPAGLREGTDGANRLRLTNVRFNRFPRLSDLAHLVTVTRESGGRTFTPQLNDFNLQLNYLATVFPIDEATIPTSPHATTQLEVDMSIDGAKRCPQVLSDVRQLIPRPANKKVLLALFDTGLECAGIGDDGYAYDTPGGDFEKMAHELGHAFGLLHAGPPPGHGSNCQGTVGSSDCAECKGRTCDNDWPWPHGTIGATGFDILRVEAVPEIRPTCLQPGACDNGTNEDGDIWEDLFRCQGIRIEQIDEDCPGNEFRNPLDGDWTQDPHDVMSYGPCSRWVSPRTWIRLYNAFTGANLNYPRK